jgi:hypothetical protein
MTLPSLWGVGIARRVGGRRRAKNDSRQRPLTHSAWGNT